MSSSATSDTRRAPITCVESCDASSTGNYTLYGNRCIQSTVSIQRCTAFTSCPTVTINCICLLVRRYIHILVAIVCQQSPCRLSYYQWNAERGTAYLNLGRLIRTNQTKGGQGYSFRLVASTSYTPARVGQHRTEHRQRNVTHAVSLSGGAAASDLPVSVSVRGSMHSRSGETFACVVVVDLGPRATTTDTLHHHHH